VAQDAHSAWPEDALEVGRIGDAWGLKGEFHVLPHADPPTALRAATRWHLRPAHGAAPRPGTAPLPPSLEIASFRLRGDGFVASSPAVTDRTAAEALRGARIFIPRSQFPAPQRDEFYWADLIGMAVVNRDGVVLGSVVGLLDNGTQSVLRVAAAADGNELLIPFVSVYVDDVDLGAHRIAVDWRIDY
jgi:16S rRNA processing protein RimM